MRTPANVRTVLSRCLEKDPNQRIRDMGDVRLGMGGAFESIRPGGNAGDGRSLPAWRWISQLALVGLAGALVAGLAVWQRTGPAAGAVTRFALQLPTDLQVVRGPGIEFATSDDGRTVVFAGDQAGHVQLYRHALDRLAPEAIPGTDGARTPFFSPDGQTVGFVTNGELRRVPLAGGPVATIVDVPGGVRGVDWLPDDTIVFGTNQGLWRAPATGGRREPLTILDSEKGENWHVTPVLLPDGETLIFTAFSGIGAAITRIDAVSLQTGERTALLEGGTRARFFAPGYLVYSGIESGSTTDMVWAVPFDADRLEVRGEPVLMFEGVNVANNAAQFTLAENGTLVSVPATDIEARRTLVWMDRQGRLEGVADLPIADYRSVRASPDGTRLALEIRDGADGTDVWSYDIARGTLNPITTHPADNTNPLWTPDGRQVVFTSRREGVLGLFRRNADGTGNAERLMTEADALNVLARAWTPDGDTLLFERLMSGGGGSQSDLALLSMETEPRVSLLFGSQFTESRPALSPNGRWIAYESDRSGRPEIYVERFPDLGERQAVSTQGGWQPRWSPDGRELFYIEGQEQLMVVGVTAEAEFTAGSADLLVEGQFLDYLHKGSFDVAPDGRLVSIQRGRELSGSAASPQITVVLNWLEELKERVPLP